MAAQIQADPEMYVTPLQLYVPRETSKGGQIPLPFSQNPGKLLKAPWHNLKITVAELGGRGKSGEVKGNIPWSISILFSAAIRSSKLTESTSVLIRLKLINISITCFCQVCWNFRFPNGRGFSGVEFTVAESWSTIIIIQ